MAPKEIRSQFLEPLKVTLFGKGVFADAIRILSWRDYPALTRKTLNAAPRSFETDGGSTGEQGPVKTEAEPGGMQP